MKKFTALTLILLLLALSLTACSSAPLGHKIRWDNTKVEELTYNITLVDPKDANTETKVVYDYALINEEKADQIKPESATGTYTTRIEATGAENTDKLTTTLDLTEVYLISDVKDSAFLAKLEAQGVLIEKTATTFTVHTTITTSVTFNHFNYSANSSQRAVKGAYIGKDRCEVNNYTVSCVYADGKKNDTCALKIVDNVGNRNVDETVTVATTGEYFDNELLLQAIRSYDVGSFSNNFSLSVFEPLSARNVTTLAMVSQTNKVFLSNKYTLDLVQVGVGNSNSVPYMYISFCTDEKITFEAAERQASRIMKIQQGYLVFTLCDEDIEMVKNNIPSK